MGCELSARQNAEWHARVAANDEWAVRLPIQYGRKIKCENAAFWKQSAAFLDSTVVISNPKLAFQFGARALAHQNTENAEDTSNF